MTPLDFEWPTEGDRIRVWYRSLYSDSRVPRSVVGTVTDEREGITWSIDFTTDDDDTYLLSRRARNGLQLSKGAPWRTNLYGQSYSVVSRSVRAISTLPAEAFGRTPSHPRFRDPGTVSA